MEYEIAHYHGIKNKNNILLQVVEDTTHKQCILLIYCHDFIWNARNKSSKTFAKKTKVNEFEAKKKLSKVFSRKILPNSKASRHLK